MMIDLTDADRSNILELLRLAWANGNVKSETEGVALSALRAKIEAKQSTPPPTSPAEAKS